MVFVVSLRGEPPRKPPAYIWAARVLTALKRRRLWLLILVPLYWIMTKLDAHGATVTSRSVPPGGSRLGKHLLTNSGVVQATWSEKPIGMPHKGEYDYEYDTEIEAEGNHDLPPMIQTGHIKKIAVNKTAIIDMSQNSENLVWDRKHQTGLDDGYGSVDESQADRIFDYTPGPSFKKGEPVLSSEVKTPQTSQSADVKNVDVHVVFDEPRQAVEHNTTNAASVTTPHDLLIAGTNAAPQSVTNSTYISVLGQNSGENKLDINRLLSPEEEVLPNVSTGEESDLEAKEALGIRGEGPVPPNGDSNAMPALPSAESRDGTEQLGAEIADVNILTRNEALLQMHANQIQTRERYLETMEKFTVRRHQRNPDNLPGQVEQILEDFMQVASTENEPPAGKTSIDVVKEKVLFHRLKELLDKYDANVSSNVASLLDQYQDNSGIVANSPGNVKLRALQGQVIPSVDDMMATEAARKAQNAPLESGAIPLILNFPVQGNRMGHMGTPSRGNSSLTHLLSSWTPASNVSIREFLNNTFHLNSSSFRLNLSDYPKYRSMSHGFLQTRIREPVLEARDISYQDMIADQGQTLSNTRLRRNIEEDAIHDVNYVETDSSAKTEVETEEEALNKQGHKVRERVHDILAHIQRYPVSSKVNITQQMDAASWTHPAKLELQKWHQKHPLLKPAINATTGDHAVEYPAPHILGDKARNASVLALLKTAGGTNATYIPTDSMLNATVLALERALMEANVTIPEEQSEQVRREIVELAMEILYEEQAETPLDMELEQTVLRLEQLLSNLSVPMPGDLHQVISEDDIETFIKQMYRFVDGGNATQNIKPDMERELPVTKPEVAEEVDFFSLENIAARLGVKVPSKLSHQAEKEIIRILGEMRQMRRVDRRHQLLLMLYLAPGRDHGNILAPPASTCSVEKNMHHNQSLGASTNDSLFFRVGLQEELDRSLEGGPMDYLPNYKNPCWVSKIRPEGVSRWYGYTQKLPAFHNMSVIFNERLTKGQNWRLRCMPYFYIAGVTKSGTTDLYSRLVHHPDVKAPAHKEPFFWNRLSLGIPENRRKSFRYYLDFFDIAAENIRKKAIIKDGRPFHPGITVDATPAYLWDYDCWTSIPGNQGLEEPRFILAHTLRKLAPDSRVILLLRNPTERLYSQYRMKSHRESRMTFHKWCEEAINNYNTCLMTRTIRSCTYDWQLSPFEFSFPGGMFLRASLYYIYVRDWLKVFPNNQIMIIQAENYYANTAPVLKKVFHFLGLRRLSPVDLVYISRKDAVNTRQDDAERSLEPMLPETKHLLDDFFRPFNERLAKLLKDDRFLWRD